MHVLSGRVRGPRGNDIVTWPCRGAHRVDVAVGAAAAVAVVGLPGLAIAGAEALETVMWNIRRRPALS